MKNYRNLVPVVLIVLLLASWYKLISGVVANSSVYEGYVSEARKYAETGITTYAIENYEKAIDEKSSPALYAEVADYYRGQGDTRALINWCEDFIEAYPKEAIAYEYLLKAYFEDNNYIYCYNTIEAANNRNIKSEYIDEVNSQIAYNFELGYDSYDEVGVFSNFLCPVHEKDEGWGFVNRYGDVRIATNKLEVGVFTSDEMAPIVNSKGEAYFVNATGDKVKATNDTSYEAFGAISDGIIPARKNGGKYCYLDSDFNYLFGDYDFASTFNGEVAAVLVGDKWQIINAKGEAITSEKYDDVKLDGKNIAFRNGRMFVKTSQGKYLMLDDKGSQVGSNSYEDVNIFFSKQPAAVKMNGKWQFIDENGNVAINGQFDGARSFQNDLAAVCVNGQWGYIDIDGNMVIEPQFEDARDFNEKGSAFVKNTSVWKLLMLYRLNRR